MAAAAAARGGPPLIAELRGAVLTLTLGRGPVNALDDALVGAIEAALDHALGDPAVAVLHLRSDARAFCAGADLELVRSGIGGGATELDRLLAWVQRLQRLFDRVEAAPLVSLAEIGGAALGGGLELALACDLRIAAGTARLGFPEAGLGLLAAGGGTQRAAQVAGRAVASRLLLGAEVVDGWQAERLGLVQWAVPAEELAPRALALVERLAALPAPALRAAKDCIAAAFDPVRDGFAAEIEHTRALYREPASRARVGEFLARRRAVPKESA
jgi:enoyl-CoA hydratase/carnithine racemase